MTSGKAGRSPMKYRMLVAERTDGVGTIYEFASPSSRYDGEMRALRHLADSGNPDVRVLRLTGQMADRAVRHGSVPGSPEEFASRFPEREV